MKKIYTLFFLAVSLFSFKAKAQSDSTSKYNDYVINFKGDTLKCSISGPLIGSGNGHYKLTETDKSQKLDAKKIKEYYIRKKGELNR